MLTKYEPGEIDQVKLAKHGMAWSGPSRLET